MAKTVSPMYADSDLIQHLNQLHINKDIEYGKFDMQTALQVVKQNQVAQSRELIKTLEERTRKLASTNDKTLLVDMSSDSGANASSDDNGRSPNLPTEERTCCAADEEYQCYPATFWEKCRSAKDEHTCKNFTVDSKMKQKVNPLLRIIGPAAPDAMAIKKNLQRAVSTLRQLDKNIEIAGCPIGQPSIVTKMHLDLQAKVPPGSMVSATLPVPKAVPLEIDATALHSTEVASLTLEPVAAEVILQLVPDMPSPVASPISPSKSLATSPGVGSDANLSIPKTLLATAVVGPFKDATLAALPFLIGQRDAVATTPQRQPQQALEQMPQSGDDESSGAYSTRVNTSLNDVSDAESEVSDVAMDAAVPMFNSPQRATMAFALPLGSMLAKVDTNFSDKLHVHSESIGTSSNAIGGYEGKDEAGARDESTNSPMGSGQRAPSAEALGLRERKMQEMATHSFERQDPASPASVLSSSAATEHAEKKELHDRIRALKILCKRSQEEMRAMQAKLRTTAAEAIANASHTSELHQRLQQTLHVDEQLRADLETALVNTEQQRLQLQDQTESARLQEEHAELYRQQLLARIYDLEQQLEARIRTSEAEQDTSSQQRQQDEFVQHLTSLLEQSRAMLSETSVELEAVRASMEIVQNVQLETQDCLSEAMAKNSELTNQLESAAGDITELTADLAEAQNQTLTIAHSYARLQELYGMLQQQRKEEWDLHLCDHAASHKALLQALQDMEEIEGQYIALQCKYKNLQMRMESAARSPASALPHGASPDTRASADVTRPSTYVAPNYRAFRSEEALDHAVNQDSEVAISSCSDYADSASDEGAILTPTDERSWRVRSPAERELAVADWHERVPIKCNADVEAFEPSSDIISKAVNRTKASNTPPSSPLSVFADRPLPEYTPPAFQLHDNETDATTPKHAEQGGTDSPVVKLPLDASKAKEGGLFASPQARHTHHSSILHNRVSNPWDVDAYAMEDSEAFGSDLSDANDEEQPKE